MAFRTFVGALIAAPAAAALVAIAPSGALADEPSAGLGSVVAPVTAALGVNVACPVNVNVLGNQGDSGNCASPAQANVNSAETPAGHGRPSGVIGTVVAPVTAAAGANVSCLVNANVLGNQHDSGNCSSSQANVNTSNARGGEHHGGGATVTAPVTAGGGVNVTCLADVNVVATQGDSGNCESPSQGNTNSSGSTTDGGGSGSGEGGGGGSGEGQGSTEMSITPAAAVTSTESVPGPPVAGALSAAGHVPVPVAIFLLAALLVTLSIAKRMRTSS